MWAESLIVCAYVCDLYLKRKKANRGTYSLRAGRHLSCSCESKTNKKVLNYLYSGLHVKLMHLPLLLSFLCCIYIRVSDWLCLHEQISIDIKLNSIRLQILNAFFCMQRWLVTIDVDFNSCDTKQTLCCQTKDRLYALLAFQIKILCMQRVALSNKNVPGNLYLHVANFN